MKPYRARWIPDVVAVGLQGSGLRWLAASSLRDGVCPRALRIPETPRMVHPIGDYLEARGT